MRLSNVEEKVKKIDVIGGEVKTIGGKIVTIEEKEKAIEEKVKKIEEKVGKIDDIEFNLKTLMSHFNLEYKKSPQ